MDDHGLCHGRDRGESSSSSSSSSIEIQNQWREIQDLLKERLITQDDFPWKLPIPSSSGNVAVEEEEEGTLLKYVGGVDAPILLQLLQKMKNTDNPFYPQVVSVLFNSYCLLMAMVCFILEASFSPSFSIESSFLFMHCITYSKQLSFTGFGLACHLGVLANIPTIAIGKNLHHVDGLTQSGVRKLLQAKDSRGEDFITLTGSSGPVWGAAMRSTKGSCKPIYISVGHRVSLNTAIKIVKMICKYRVPEPIRQADIRSRDHLQKNSCGNGGTLQ
ncbi:endonuclease V isoform X1 [Populus alba x Populus x berolinensis]|nr:endonuclease V isoform X1 [Populus alba x Populus x berolinensis]